MRKEHDTQTRKQPSITIAIEARKSVSTQKSVNTADIRITKKKKQTQTNKTRQNQTQETTKTNKTIDKHNK